MYLVVFTIFIFNPILSLFLTFIEVLNRKKYAAFLFSFTMGLLAFVLIPMEGYDLIRVYEEYSYFKSLNFDQLLYYLSFNLDFLFYVYSWILAKLSLPKELLPFTSIFLIYYIFITIYIDWVKRNNVNKNQKFVFLILIILFIPFLSTYSGIRNNTGLSFFVLGLYNFLIYKKHNGLLFIFLANLIHFMTIFLSVLLFISYIVRNHRLVRFIFLLSFVLLILPSNPVINFFAILDFSNEALQHRQFSYLGGSGWSDFFLPGLSLNGRIFFVITMLSYFLSLIYLIVTHNNSFLRNFIYMIAIFTNIFSSVPGTLYKRYSIALVFIFVILILFEYREYLWFKLKSKFLYILILVFLLSRISDIYTSRAMILESYKEVISFNIFSFFKQEIDENRYVLEK